VEQTYSNLSKHCALCLNTKREPLLLIIAVASKILDNFISSTFQNVYRDRHSTKTYYSLTRVSSETSIIKIILPC